jgi:micrococcal nuclease
MPIKGNYRVRTGKNSGLVVSQRQGSGKGCWSVLYWIFIGWWVFPIKWFFIGLIRLVKWLSKSFPVWVESITDWIETRLESDGHAHNHQKIKTGVTLGFIALIFGACLLTGVFSNSNAASATPTAKVNLIPTTATEILFTSTFPATSTTSFTSTAALTLTPTVFFTPTVTLPAIDPAACVPSDTLRQTGTVTKITDGDTIHVDIDGQDYTVRYIGMDAPETGKINAPAATAYNSQLVANKVITLVKDISETDRYGRLLRYVFVGDKFVNYELVRLGLAESGTWEPDNACDATFKAAQQTARANNVGMWIPTATIKPYVAPVPTSTTVSNEAGLVGGGTSPTSAVSSSNCDPSYPTVCIPPPPPDLDCKDISFRRFKVIGSDPHHFDSDGDGIGCES